MKSFNYVNRQGFNKIIEVYPEKTNEQGDYYCEIWAGQNSTMETTGVFCGTDYMSKYDLNEFFTYYGIDFQFPEDE